MCVLKEEGIGRTHQPRGDFPPLAQLQQGRQAEVIWKQKNKISGEGRTPETHLGRKRPQAKAWERQKGWKKGRSRGRNLGVHSLIPQEKGLPQGKRGRGAESGLAGEAGLDVPGVTRESTLTEAPRMTTACRLVPTPRIAALRIAASGSPPPPGRRHPARG